MHDKVMNETYPQLTKKWLFSFYRIMYWLSLPKQMTYSFKKTTCKVSQRTPTWYSFMQIQISKLDRKWQKEKVTCWYGSKISSEFLAAYLPLTTNSCRPSCKKFITWPGLWVILNFFCLAEIDRNAIQS